MHENAFLGKAYCRDISSIDCSYMIRVVAWRDVCKVFLIHFEDNCKRKVSTKIIGTFCCHTTTPSNRTRRP